VRTIEKSIEVNVPVSTAYDQWTQVEEFPKFMVGVESVTQLDDAHVRWVVQISGRTAEWTAEINGAEAERARRLARRRREGERGRRHVPPSGREADEDRGSRLNGSRNAPSRRRARRSAPTTRCFASTSSASRR
jgi:hypothetical protein